MYFIVIYFENSHNIHLKGTYLSMNLAYIEYSNTPICTDEVGIDLVSMILVNANGRTAVPIEKKRNARKVHRRDAS